MSKNLYLRVCLYVCFLATVHKTYFFPWTGFILGSDCRQEVISVKSDSLHTLLIHSNGELQYWWRRLPITVVRVYLQPLYSLQEQQKCVNFGSKSSCQLLNSPLAVDCL